jgi:hypothetical protein
MALTRQLARVVAEAMFHRDVGPVPADRLNWLSEDFVDFLEQAGPRAELIIGGALQLATWVAPLAIGKRPPLSRLTVDQRIEALERLEKTPAGLPLLALKAVMCTIYYEHADAQAEIGMRGGCRGDAP